MVLRISLIAIFLLFTLTCPSNADIIHLKNGDRLEGVVIQEKENEVVVKLKYGTVSFMRAEIEKIEKQDMVDEIGEGPPPLTAATEEEMVKHKGRMYTKERFEDLKKAKGLIEYKGQWMTPHEKTGLELEQNVGNFNKGRLIRYASPAVVSLKIDDSTLASGVFINSNGLILTCWHAVADAKKIKVKLFGDKGIFTLF